MAVCPNCGEDNPNKAKFCPECATPLKAAPSQAEERKVVSVLFVDLVGFTARSHDADPEDVRAALAPYHRLLKTEIERFGGTVEKFIGDAVMAVFGAPVAHEDDAERAVRAALRITEAIEELNEATPNLDLSIRAAVNTGEGLVTLAARPQAGEGMVTGDVVNTASRLQGIAPVGGVAVGEITYRSTKDFISYERLDPVTVKGKPEPIPVWRAVSARSRFGVDVDIPQDPFHRARLRSRCTQERLPADCPGSLGSVGDHHRRAGSGKDQTAVGVLFIHRRPGRTRLLATGTLSSLWRGHHVLGVGRDRQGPGGNPGVRPPRPRLTSWPQRRRGRGR